MKRKRSGSRGKREEIDERKLARIALLGTPLYEEPDEGSPKLAYLNKGTVTKILSDEQGFLQVETIDGATGYIRKANAL